MSQLTEMTPWPDERLRKLCDALRKDGFYAIANEIESESDCLNSEIFRQNLLIALFRNV